MIRHGTRPIIILVNNRGYIIEDAIHQGPYNTLRRNWWLPIRPTQERRR